jgi:hypothetical protein
LELIMKKSIAPATPATVGLHNTSAAATPAAAQLHASPHMVAQRAQLAGAFGPAQLAPKKKPPQQHKSDTSAQLKGEKKKPGSK